MKGNKNSIKYTWTLIFDNGKIFKKDSLIELRKCCPEIKESSFRRIAENKMKDITKYSFKIIKEKLDEGAFRNKIVLKFISIKFK